MVVFITPHVVRERKDADILRDYERNRLNTDPLNQLDAPFSRPLDINPEDLKRQRAEPPKLRVPAPVERFGQPRDEGATPKGLGAGKGKPTEGSVEFGGDGSGVLFRPRRPTPDAPRKPARPPG